jgi:hypothetical protein
MAKVNGGTKIVAALNRIEGRAGAVLRVGFLRNARYKDGTQVAMVAAVQEYGSPVNNIPPRPFFRNMIAKYSREWPKAIADLLRVYDYDTERALDEAGATIEGQLRQSVVDTNSPPLKPATIRRKGSEKPLVETGHMLNSIDHEVRI